MGCKRANLQYKFCTKGTESATNVANKRRLALSLNKIGGASAIKKSELKLDGLHYL